MSNDKIYKELMVEYEKDRIRASRLLDQRKETLFNEIPRLELLFDELQKTGFYITKEILNNKGNVEERIEELKNKNSTIKDEIKKTLFINNYPEDYLESIYKCSICKDTGYVDTEKCKCFKQKLISKFYKMSNLDNVLAEENFDNFDLSYYSNTKMDNYPFSPMDNIKNIHKICTMFVKNCPDVYENLLFYGETGLGKTFMCNCIAKDVLDKGNTVLYATAPELFKVLEDYRFNRSDMENPQEYIEMLANVDLLIIDDLGTELATTVTISELFSIVNSRMLAKKHILISTNLAPDEFNNTYTYRISSRITGNYKMLNFIGNDIRLQKKYKGL